MRERRGSREALVHHTTEPVDIRGWADIAATDLLWGHVIGRSEGLSQLRQNGPPAVLSKPEVSYLGASPLAEEDVPRFDIAMHELRFDPAAQIRGARPGRRRHLSRQRLRSSRPAGLAP
jgi:hypothetical protein